MELAQTWLNQITQQTYHLTVFKLRLAPATSASCEYFPILAVFVINKFASYNQLFTEG